MKDLLIVANWKSNKSQQEADLWIANINLDTLDANKKVVICPPFTLLSAFSQHFPVEKLGAQNISPFSAGAYTGEVNALQVKEFAAYVLIGHSERRQYFKEDDEIIQEKVMQAKSAMVIPIVCVQGVDTPIPQGVDIVAYEPIWAIGTGKAESPIEANEVCRQIFHKTHVKTVLYGGSVTEENVHTFTELEYIGGVLVGGASLDPQKFSQIIAHA